MLNQRLGTGFELEEVAHHHNVVRAPKLYSRVLWVSDLHVPYHDPQCLDIVLQYAADWKPNQIVLGGDQLDFYTVSKYSKDPERKETLQDEINIAKPIWQEFKAACKSVVFMLGNHEVRLSRYLQDVTAFQPLDVLKVHSLLDLPKSWTVLDGHAQYRLGNLTLVHGDVPGMIGPKHVASHTLHRFRTNVLMGHYHREQCHSDPGYEFRPRTAWVSGHLSDPRHARDFALCSAWTQGFSSIDTDPRTGDFSVSLHTIRDGKCRIGGTTYKG